MYKEYNLKLGYQKVYDKTFVPLCLGVIKSMKGNTNFPDAGELVTALETAFNKYQLSIPSKQERSEITVAIKDANRDIVKKKLRKLGFHIQMVAEDDLEKLKSSGVPVAKFDSSPSPELPMPVILSMTTNGTPGQLTVKCKSVKAAKLYDVRISKDKTNWIYTATDNKSTVTVDNLPTDVLLFVQIRMRDTEHTTPWSATVETRIFNSAIAIQTSN